MSLFNSAYEECETIRTDNYREYVVFRPLQTQSGVTEVAIYTQLLNARHPDERRVKSLSIIQNDKLWELYQQLGTYLGGRNANQEGSIMDSKARKAKVTDFAYDGEYLKVAFIREDGQRVQGHYRLFGWLVPPKEFLALVMKGLKTPPIHVVG